MRNYETFGTRETKALDALLAGRSLDGYDDAVLHRVLRHLYESHQVIGRAVLEGTAPSSAATKVFEDGIELAEIIKTRAEARAAKWKADNRQSVARAHALAARALQPTTFWQRLWG